MSLFKVHKLNSEGLVKAELIQEVFSNLLSQLETIVTINGSPREFSVCKTKLEEACFYAKKSMAMNPANQEK